MAKKNDTTLSKAIRSAIKKNREKMFPGHGGRTKCAEKFGVSRQMWSNWETGVSTPGNMYQRKLAEFFDIGLAELRGDKEERAPSSMAPGAEQPTYDSVLRILLSAQSALSAFSNQLQANRPQEDRLLDGVEHQEAIKALQGSVADLQELLATFVHFEEKRRRMP